MSNFNIGNVLSVLYPKRVEPYLGIIYSNNKDGTISVYFPEDSSTSRIQKDKKYIPKNNRNDEFKELIKQVKGLIVHQRSRYVINKAIQEFEKNNPDIFIGMYQFWCQKLD